MTAVEPEYGRLDRILTEQATARHGPISTCFAPGVSLCACGGAWYAGGCTRQGSPAPEVDDDTERLRAMAAALEAECAAKDDLIAALTHTFDPSTNGGIFGCHVCGVEREADPRAPVHRTLAVVRAELEGQ